MTAPTGRIASVAVIVKTSSDLVTPNSLASVSTRNTTTKKSNASSIQPKKPAVTACQWRVDCAVGLRTGFCSVIRGISKRELEEHDLLRNAITPSQAN